ncbi:DUF4367 domain-containing protein [Mediterraneibacter massiliensis]|uniref:DUF4367 domain-containing protein n=1 Tax=Mediterraneibacter massiliensis TaxID=1720300 RepID=UPI0022E25F27|nr:DUF4367 domain-containing protein [Mediterraneibacter massiliensis]
MNKYKKLSLQKEIEKEAKKIEKEVSEDPALKGIQVSDEFDAAFLKKIEEYEKKRAEKENRTVIHADDTEFAGELMPEPDKLLAEKNNKKYFTKDDKNISGTVTIYRRKKKKYLFIAFAAVLILVLGSGLTSIGSKSYWKVLWERAVGDEKAAVINVEDMEVQKTEDVEDSKVYKEINKSFGISAVRLGYKPIEMTLENYNIDKEQKKAQLFYSYNDNIVKYIIYLNSADSSLGQKELDELTEEYSMQVNSTNISIEEYKKEDSYRYNAKFSYKGIHYQLKGVMEKKEFEKIIQNLRFL